MDDDFLVEGAIAKRSRLVENEHITIARSSIRGGLEGRIIGNADIGPCLHEANNGIIAQAAAIEVGGLVVAGGLSEAELISAIMIPVGAVEQLDRGGGGVGARIGVRSRGKSKTRLVVKPTGRATSGTKSKLRSRKASALLPVVVLLPSLIQPAGEAFVSNASTTTATRLVKGG